MDPHPPTLSDVAARAGVSLATASRVLNGSERTVKPDLRQRVISAAAELGYSTNVQAQAVARGRSTTVALVVGDIADPYFAGISRGVIDVARERGLVVTISSTGPYDGDSGVSREGELLAALRRQRPCAVVFAGTRVVGEPTDITASDRTAVIGGGAPHVRTVRVDNRGGALALARELTSRGYREFTVLAGPNELITVRDRVEGFREHVPDAQVVSTEFSRAGGYRAMCQLLDSGFLAECVFAVADVMALGAMAALRERGYEPGRDMAVAGFDDIPLVSDVTPALTSVSLPLYQIGAQALELALADDTVRESALIPAHVRIRASTPGVENVREPRRSCA